MQFYNLEAYLDYTLIVNTTLDDVLYKRVSRSCPIKKGYVDQKEMVEVWVCKEHKELYIASKDKTYFEQMFQFLKDYPLNPLPWPKKDPWWKRQSKSPPF
jgi:hypothetical protein